MKPITFVSPELFVATINRIASEKVFDDLWLRQFPQAARNYWYYYTESVPGICMVSDIVPYREAALTLILFEKPGKRYKALIDECKAAMQEVFQKAKLKRMVTYTTDQNKKSQMFATHVGFHRDGVSRLGMSIDGELYDQVQYSIFPHEVNTNGTKSKIRECAHAAGDETGAAKPGRLSGAVRDADAGVLPRPDQRAREPLFVTRWLHALRDVFVKPAEQRH